MPFMYEDKKRYTLPYYTRAYNTLYMVVFVSLFWFFFSVVRKQKRDLISLFLTLFKFFLKRPFFLFTVIRFLSRAPALHSATFFFVSYIIKHTSSFDISEEETPCWMYEFSHFIQIRTKYLKYISIFRADDIII